MEHPAASAVRPVPTRSGRNPPAAMKDRGGRGRTIAPPLPRGERARGEGVASVPRPCAFLADPFPLPPHPTLSPQGRGKSAQPLTLPLSPQGRGKSRLPLPPRRQGRARAKRRLRSVAE